MPSRTDLVRIAHDALSRGDAAAVIAVCDPGFRLDMTDRVLNPEVYEGHAGVERFLAEVHTVWESFTWEPIETQDDGDRVIVYVHSVGRGGASGLELDRHSAFVWRASEESLLEAIFFRDPARAREGPR